MLPLQAWVDLGAMVTMEYSTFTKSSTITDALPSADWTIYIDDILVFSESKEQDLKDLWKVLDSWRKLPISIINVNFFKNSIDFLGYNICKKELTPTTQKVLGSKNLTKATDSKSLRRFLGLVNLYRKWIPQVAVDIFLTEDVNVAQKKTKKQKNTEIKPSWKQSIWHHKRNSCQTIHFDPPRSKRYVIPSSYR